MYLTTFQSNARIVTPAERAARTGKPIAQFRVKGGCKTCKPVPVFSKPVQSVDRNE
jgi:hypothetical protein